LGGKYVPRAVLFDLESGVIGAVTLSRRSASSSARLRRQRCAPRYRINVTYHEALGGKYVPRAVLFDLEPGVIGAVTFSRRKKTLQPGLSREPYTRAKTGPKTTTKFF
jgi:hypothetical protein